MYQVYSDSFLLYSGNLESLQIVNPKLELEDNKAGTFTFTIYPEHPYYAEIRKMYSIITVFDESNLIFRGRVLNDEIGFYNQKTITCEGDLAFFFDSVQRPYDFTGSIEEFITQLLATHNQQVDSFKQFTLGNVTVTDPNDYIVRSDIDYTKTWDVMEKKLLDELGGHLIIRHSDGVNYLDYLVDYSTISNQKIEFASNLLDMNRIRKGEDIITALIPLGAKLVDESGEETGERLTIKSVNDDSDYIFNQEAVDEFGWIFGTQIWDDVTVAANLLHKGQAYLAGFLDEKSSIEITAADLSGIRDNISAFHIGTYVNVFSEKHGINQNFLISKLSIDLLNPANNKLTLGGTIDTFTDQASGIGKTTIDISGKINQLNTDNSQAIYNLQVNLESQISQTETNIYSRVAEDYYLKTETDALVSSVSTIVEQNKNSVDILFEQYAADLDSLAAGTDAEFADIKKYIRFIDGKILLGEVGNELELQISNDKISFLQDNAEVAYFSENKLFVTDAEITNSLDLGNFAFIPRESGNLSFKKVK